MCCWLVPVVHAKDQRSKFELAALVEVCVCSLRPQLLFEVWFDGFNQWIFVENISWALPWMRFV